MEVGIIAPVRKLEEYCTTKVQYCLPTLMNESREYGQFYCRKAKEGNTIIVDCARIGWRREPENLDLVQDTLDKLDRVNNIIVVLPSKMFNWEKTVETAKEYADGLSGYKLAVCLEGTTREEVAKCSYELSNLAYYYAVPSYLLRLLEEPLPRNLIWLDNHLKLEETPREGKLIVTSLPVRLGLEGRVLSYYLPSPSLLDFWHEDFTWEKIVKKNIKETVEFYGAI